MTVSTLTRSQELLKIALSGKKERESLIGKQVKYISKDYSKKQLETGGTYTIKEIMSGNYESFIKLEGLPEKFYHADTSRRYSKNYYNINDFELV